MLASLRRPTTLAPATVLLLAAAACASAPATGQPVQVVARAADATVQAGPARVTVDRFGLHAEGVVDLSRDAVRLTVESTATRTGKVEVLAVGDRTWQREVGAATWVLQAAEADLLSLPGGLRSGDPRAAVAMVRGASKVTVFGGLQVQQTSTIRYDLKIDPQAAAAAAPVGARRELDALAAAVDHTVRVDVYVDNQGRIRRLEVPEDLVSETPATRSDSNRISATIDLLAFGVPADGLDPPT